jgi:LPS export ABC transporter permease LptF/LPS export ABC transporter permease LptG
MSILNRYIFRETLVPSLIALMVLTFLLFSRELGRFLEMIVRQSATPGQIWAISRAIIPYALTYTIPMAVLVGVLTGFGRMSSDSEATAFRAVGISMKRLLMPVMLLGVSAWIVNLVLTVWIAPDMAARLSGLERDMVMRQVSLELKPRVFNERLPNRALYVQESAADGLHWRGILLSDMTNPDSPSVTFARSGALVQDEATRRFQVTLTDGNTHIVSPLTPGRYSFSTFQSNTISVPMPEAIIAREPAPPQIATRTLWAAVRAGSATYEERVEFHRRIALPFACLSFVLIALPLGVSTTRGSKSMGLVLSLMLMLVYYLVFIAGTRIASTAQVSPFFGTWLANIGFTVLGVILLSRADRERENRVLTFIASVISRVSSRTNRVRPAGKKFGTWAYSFTHHPKVFRVLDIYVLRGFWFFFLLVLVVFAALFVIVTLFELLPDILKNNVDTSIIANYFLFLLPQIVYLVAPLTVLLAVLINLGTLTKTNEILAVKAGAVSLYRMAMPLLLMGLLLSGSLYVMQDFLLPYSNQRQDEFRNVIKGRALQTYRNPERKWMVGSDDRIYHYSYFDPDANLFGGISVFAFKPGTFELNEWVFATRAEWDTFYWTLHDGWVRKLGPNNSVDYQPFDRLQFPAMDNPDYFKKEVRPAAQMTYVELKRYIADLEHSGFDVSSLTVDLNRKLSFPLVAFIMAIIGVPFSFTTGKKGAFYGIGLCVAVGIIYWSTFELFDKLGAVNRLSPLIAAWFPNLIFGSGGLWMMLRVKT